MHRVDHIVVFGGPSTAQDATSCHDEQSLFSPSFVVRAVSGVVVLKSCRNLPGLDDHGPRGEFDHFVPVNLCLEGNGSDVDF